MKKEIFQQQFEKQITNTRKKNVYDFLDNPKYIEIKQAYALNYNRIRDLIVEFGAKLAIENIEHLIGISIDDILFFKDINPISIGPI